MRFLSPKIIIGLLLYFDVILINTTLHAYQMNSLPYIRIRFDDGQSNLLLQLFLHIIFLFVALFAYRIVKQNMSRSKLYVLSALLTFYNVFAIVFAWHDGFLSVVSSLLIANISVLGLIGFIAVIYYFYDSFKQDNEEHEKQEALAMLEKIKDEQSVT
jgi:formate hydrogenlyase subunit 3/multisubunit Na+/H+ antiporter MnhD subunit